MIGDRIESSSRDARRASKTVKRLAAAAAVFAALGVAAVIAMPEPLRLVPATPAGGAAPQLYYESAFPTPGDEPLQRPVSVAVLRSHVFVADSVAGVVRVFDERGVPESVVGSGALLSPTYVACDPVTDRVYVTDRKRNALFWFAAGRPEVRRIEPRWLAPAAASTRSVDATSFSPLGVAVGSSGMLWVTDVSARHRILALDARSQVVREVGGPGGASPVVVALDYPNDVALVRDELWVSDSNHGRVVVFDEQGRYLRAMNLRGIVRGLVAIPDASGEATAVAGVDALGHQIVLWDTEGEEIGRFGEPGTTAGRLQYPNDVAASADGNRLYVADTGNRRIQVWRVEWEREQVPAKRALAVDASNRVPYVAAALASFVATLASAVIAASLWQKGRLEGARERAEDGPPVLE